MTPEQQAFYVDLFQEVTQTAEYKDYMERQALKPIFLTGSDMQAGCLSPGRPKSRYFSFEIVMTPTSKL